MKSILKWINYSFFTKPDAHSPVIIAAPTFVEAINTYHEVTHV